MAENDQEPRGLGWGYVMCQQIAVVAFAFLSLQADVFAGVAPDPLAVISIQPEHDDGTYQRVHWMPGGAWIDADNDCQDGRQEILIAQSTIKPVLTNDGCSVVSGRWVDPYTGEITTDPSKLQIDHLVALSEAHSSGGFSWLRERKQAFAQDLASGNLFAVMAATNMSKGDRDPGEWLPISAGFRCQYVRSWIAVKKNWGLSMDQAEVEAIKLLLGRC